MNNRYEHMEFSQAKKFKVSTGQKILIINSPLEYKSKFDKALKVSFTKNYNKDFQAIHLFVKNSNELQRYFNKIVKVLREGTIFWLFYPKLGSGMKSDLSRDKILEFMKKYPVKISTLVSYDEIWSAFLIRKLKSNENRDLKKEDKKKYLPYIDYEKRIVHPPKDFLQELKINKLAFEKFNQLSFTHKKEYIEAILEAKKLETRKRRIKKAIESLSI